MLARQCLLVFVLLCLSLSTIAQVDDVGSGHAIHFDGIDDYVEMQSDYSTLNLPFTISAWINVNPSSTGALVVFSSNDYNPLYHGFELAISQGAIWCEFGDNLGGNNPAFRKGKRATVPDFYGRWTHVAAVMKSKTEMDLYINGVNVGGDIIGNSNAVMASPYPGDKAKAGYLFSNGVTYRYDGDMDELTLWSVARSESEIRDNMCHKLSGNEAGLISYWSFDEKSGVTTYDKAKKTSNGVLMGSPARVYSGAPIGDVSYQVYRPILANTSLVFVHDDANHDDIDITNPGSSVYGMHLYEVKAPPSQTSGIPAPIDDHYYGVFLVGASPLAGPVTASGQLRENGVPMPVCAFTRVDNSVSSWGSADLPQPFNSQQAEFIRVYSGPPINVDLGPDRTVCEGTSIDSGVDPTDRSFFWNTGAITPQITVKTNGLYVVRVSNGCSSGIDSLNLEVTPIDQVDLGPDVILCDQPSYYIDSHFSAPLTFKWNNNAMTSGINVTTSGLYSVTVTGTCGSSTDEVLVKLLKTPPAFSLGADGEYCILPNFHFEPMLDPNSVSFQWQDGSTGSSFDPKDFGTYWLVAKNACGVASDSVTITKAHDVDLPQIPNVITPNGDDFNENFIVPGAGDYNISLLVLNRWGERVFTSSSYQNNWDGKGLASGTYFYVVEGDCISKVKGSLSIVR